ncbi:uncharacterized protein UV8b_04748 [Ustilaginoidea virens]|uniref:Uncharacterized protein n=1 Tax=Ustilaginoidea virens TaxID=1159556 RepID=A0A8E5MI09_USTVR|nr:uncharacterized protein UV8b_04748 [Ustilaginoidea virens]QUC20507.1 hypothetical protein UV8b_04748 [Ustilaginoidea virens]
MPFRSMMASHANTPTPSGNLELSTTPRPNHNTRRGRGLAHLVSKFEVLELMSRQGKPAPASRGSLGGRVDSTTELNKSASLVSSESKLSCSTPPKSWKLRRAREDMETSLVGSGTVLPDREGNRDEKRPSMVAERRKLFEVELGNSKKRSECFTADIHANGGKLSPATNQSYRADEVPANSGHEAMRVGQKPPLMTRWQTVRARSPLACMAQSQVAVLSRPAIPNVSMRLSGYLPMSSTCPLLPNTLDLTKPHSLSDCFQEAVSDDCSSKGCSSITPRCRSSTPSSAAESQQELTARVGNASPKSQGPNEVCHTPRAAHSAVDGSPGKDDDEQNTPSRKSGKNGLLAGATNDCLHDDSGRMAGLSPYIASMSTWPSNNGLESSGPDPTLSHGQSQIRQGSCKPKEKLVMSAIASFEAVSNRSSEETTPRISSTIEHFESLISGDQTSQRHKTSLQKKKKLTASSSWQPNKADGRLKTSTMELARRKFSNSWGPARFKKIRPLCDDESAKDLCYKKPSQRRWEQSNMPTDGSVHSRDRDLSEWSERREHAGSRIKGQCMEPNDSPGSDVEPGEPSAQRCNLTLENVTGQSGKGSSRKRQPSDWRGSWRLSRRRWVSRSSIPLIAQAECTLEQPKPVRVNEVRRLVSLCRDKMTGWKHRAQN